MTGWIIKNCIPDGKEEQGELLGSDGLVYGFLASAENEDFAGLAIKTFVSFSPLPAEGAGKCGAIIQGVADEEPPDAEIGRIDEEIRSFLSPKRYLHTFRVSKIARALAIRCGYSPRKAEIGGLLHDIAKENTMEENRRIIREAGLPMTSFEENDHSILHAAAGSALAASRFGIRDQEIIDAIRYHNGRPAMKTLDKIIFLADHVDYVYKNGLRDLNKSISERDLDRAVFKMFTTINKELVKAGKRTDPITESTMNYMFVKLNGTLPSLKTAPDSGTSLSDELFDRILAVNGKRGLPIRSVRNIRDLGGCGAYDGRRVKRGMLVRSGALSRLTEEDAARLEAHGIRTVIDLRKEEEAEAAPDRNTERFRYVDCPLPALELTQYQKDIWEKYFITPPGEEKAYYLSEYLSCISMKDMYIRILTEEKAVASLKRVFTLLSAPGEGGFLIHCTSGKDRTGITAALLLLALGTPWEEVREDYYVSALARFSETEFYAQNLRRQRYAASYIDEMRYFNGIGMNFAESVSGEILSRYGSAENYLKTVLLSEEQIGLLRERFTEKTE